MINKYELCRFLVKAKKSTYAAGDHAVKTEEKDGSTTLIFKDGNYKYHDNYFGGEPFGGREVAFIDEKPIYMMVYYGTVDKSISDFKAIYKVLMNALSLIPENNPFRGPEKYKEGNFSYLNSFMGNIEKFSGSETISDGDKKVYEAKYIGGLVDQKR